MLSLGLFCRNIRLVRTLHQTAQDSKLKWKHEQLRERRKRNHKRRVNWSKDDSAKGNLELHVERSIQQVLLATNEEREVVLDRERLLHSNLPEVQLELRGLALTNLSIDPSYSVSRPGGELEIRLVRRRKAAPISGGAEWRLGRLVQLEVVGLDYEKEGWGMVSGIVAGAGSNWLTIRISHLDSFVLDSLLGGTITECGLRLTKRSLKGIYDKSIDGLTNLINKGIELNNATPVGVLFQCILSQESMFENTHDCQTVTLYNKSLRSDPSKMRALSLVSSFPPVCAIHGPPGTGKTTTLAAAVLSAVAAGEKVLVVAPSNAACDAATVALAECWPGGAQGALVRLAKKLRITCAEVEEFLPGRSEELEKAEDDVEWYRRQLLEVRGKGRGNLVKGEMEASNLCRQVVRKLEEEAVEDAQVVVATLMTGSSWMIQKLLRKGHFHLVALDEAGFTVDSDLLPLLAVSPRLVMAGDHLQLPPVVFSDSAKARGLGVSLFERFVNSCPDLVATLSTQYRSNKAISDWSSLQFYKGELEAHGNVEDRLLDELKGVKNGSKMVKSPLIWMDTSGCKWMEEVENESESFCNLDEAVLVAELVQKYIDLGVPLEDIGVISPYWAQVGVIRSLVWEDAGLKTVEINTVDGYQGREKELVIISLVRSNSEGAVGFLAETRRINVSVTRAKRCCIIVGDRETLSKDPGLDSLIEYCRINSFIVPVPSI